MSQKILQALDFKNLPKTPPLTKGFGVPINSKKPHHFEVWIPCNTNDQVQIKECLGTTLRHVNRQHVIMRAALEYQRWLLIQLPVQHVFNIQLHKYHIKPYTWKTGSNLVDRLLGRELCVLAWTIEAIEKNKITDALYNWKSLRAEERWWLFAMTATHAGNLEDNHKGWRIALRYALGDSEQNAISASSQRISTSRINSLKKHTPYSFDLFEKEE